MHHKPPQPRDPLEKRREEDNADKGEFKEREGERIKKIHEKK
jgi:hypothetical protein